MSFPTQPCFTATPNGWDSEVLKHPAMAFMHAFTKSWCETREALSQPYTDWCTLDFELGAHNGQILKGEAAAKAFIESTRLYSTSTVEVVSCHLHDTADGGYTGISTGRIYINFTVPGEKTCKDSNGREWELCVPRSYDCSFSRDPSGPVSNLKLSKMVICGDMLSVTTAAVERGLVSKETVFGA